MQAFDYMRARSVDEAVLALRDPTTRCLAGGTNLLDLMKGDIEVPVRLVDINRLPLNGITPLPDGGLRIGALVRNSDLANHRYVRERYPMLSRALLTVGVTLPPSRFTTVEYLKIRDRASYAFALVSVATGLRVVDGRIAEARIALGGVAHKPWRAEGAERALIGRRLDRDTITAASDAAVARALPLRANAFK